MTQLNQTMLRGLVTEQLQRHEGLRLFPYYCPAGKITIGYGRNLEDNGITPHEADYLLAHDVENAINDACHLFVNFALLTPNRQAVLVNMAFNLGRKRLSKFVRLRHYMQQGDYNNAAKEILDSLWAKQVGQRAVMLSRLMQQG